MEEENPNKGLYKCHDCKIIIKEEDLEDGDKCPKCHSGENLRIMCKLDTTVIPNDIEGTIQFCPECGSVMMSNGNHDCAAISRIKFNLVEAIRRVTGYLAEVGNENGPAWSAGKYQELKDRTHYNVLTGEPEKKKRYKYY